MTKVQVDLNEEQNKKVNLAKVFYKVKTKEEAIKKIIGDTKFSITNK